MRKFIAFDFETANRNRHSICSVGVVFIENGAVVDTVYSLIDPEEYFDQHNIDIHGITPDEIKDAPTFEKFYETIRNKIRDQIMIAHYLAFDGYALRDNLKRYNIQPVFNHLLCSYQLSKRLLLKQSSYTLKSLCRYYDINLDNHHDALEDAKACAELMIKLINEYELMNLESISSKTNINPGELSPNGYRSSRVKTKRFGTRLDLSNIQISQNFNEESPFYNKNIVFTGSLKAFTRNEAAQLLASVGGKPQNNIKKDTDYIILGNFDNVMIKGTKSSKLKSAERMISEGDQLEIISEGDFLKMV